MNIVGVGVDTLHFTAPLDVEHLAEELERQRKKAAAGQPEVGYNLDGEFYAMQAGGGLGYRWKLQSGRSVVILLGRRKGADTAPGIKAELGSFACWVGLKESYAHVCRAISELVRRNVWSARPTRVDLTVDFQGGAISPAMPLGMVMRGRTEATNAGPSPLCGACGWELRGDPPFCPECGWRRGRRFDGAPDVERRAGGAPVYEMTGRAYRRFRHFTGWDWGRGKPVMVRLYNKSVEIVQQSPDKVWFESIWEKAPSYVRGESVWRLEVEVKGARLRSFKIGGRRLATVEDCIENANTLWRYFVGHYRRRCRACGAYAEPRARLCECGEKVRRPRGWVEMRVKDDGEPRTTRWKLHPLWKELQDVEFQFAQPAAPEIRIVRDMARFDVALAGMLGNLATAGALKDVADEARTDEQLMEACLELIRKNVPASVLREKLIAKHLLRSRCEAPPPELRAVELEVDPVPHSAPEPRARVARRSQEEASDERRARRALALEKSYATRRRRFIGGDRSDAIALVDSDQLAAQRRAEEYARGKT